MDKILSNPNTINIIDKVIWVLMHPSSENNTDDWWKYRISGYHYLFTDNNINGVMWIMTVLQYWCHRDGWPKSKNLLLKIKIIKSIHNNL